VLSYWANPADFLSLTDTVDSTDIDDGHDPRLQIVRTTPTSASVAPGTPPLSVDARSSSEAAPSPATVMDTSPTINATIKQEPTDTIFPNTLPPAFHSEAKYPSLDMTQHSAAMLCDLQCQSSKASPTTSANSERWWAILFLFLMTQQLQASYKAILLAVWTISPSRMARMIQASAHRLTSRSMNSSNLTPLLLRSMASAQSNQTCDGLVDNAACQRASTLDASRARAKLVARSLYLLDQQRKAFEEKGRKGYEQWEDHDDKGGV
jgi:transcriptional activator HAC1